MDVDYSCYEGRAVQGGSDVVLSRGSVIVRDGEFTGRKGARPVHQARAGRPRPDGLSHQGGAMSAIDARFGHVNVTAHDWRRLAAFYTDVFGCELVPPERDIRSADLDAATGLRDAHLTGAHLRLPGFGDTGPTLEIFQYDALGPHPGGRVDRPGWGHIAFQVPDVPAAVDAVVAPVEPGWARSWPCGRRTAGRSPGLHDRPRREHRRAAGLVVNDVPIGGQRP